MMVALPRIPINQDSIAALCRKWRITEFALFGSVLRDDFRPDSDVDVLVSFSADSRWSMLDVIEMRESLEEMFGRRVDVVEKEAIRNPFRRRAILSSREVVYAD